MQPRKQKHSVLSHCTLHHFVHSFYIPTLQLPIIKVRHCTRVLRQARDLVQVLVLLISAVMLCTGLYGLRSLEDGLELSDMMAKGSAAYDFLLAREKYCRLLR